MPELTYDECRESGCGCGCGANPIKAYLKELEERMKVCGMTFEKSQMLPPQGFNEEGILNPFQIVADIYENTFKDGLDWCLNRKMNISDCVYGCSSGIVDSEKPLVHPHQRRVYYFYPAALPHMAEIISDNVEGQLFNDFDDIILFLDKLKRKEMDNSKGFGALAIYDTALRLAWNSSRDKKERYAMLPKTVWLQQGAWAGAEYLFKLGKLAKPPYKHPHKELRHKRINDRDDFPAPIAKLEPYHIENLLCIFHPLFREWWEKSN